MTAIKLTNAVNVYINYASILGLSEYMSVNNKLIYLVEVKLVC